MSVPTPAPAQTAGSKLREAIMMVVVGIVGLLAVVPHVLPTPAPTPAPAPAPAPPPTPAPAPAVTLADLADRVSAIERALASRPDAPVPAPAPASPLGKAVDDYAATLRPSIAAIAGRVESGELATKSAIVAAFAQHSQPLARALNAAVDAGCDSAGNVTDRASLAATLRQSVSAP